MRLTAVHILQKVGVPVCTFVYFPVDMRLCCSFRGIFSIDYIKHQAVDDESLIAIVKVSSQMSVEL